jgi:hypothetical protein
MLVEINLLPAELRPKTRAKRKWTNIQVPRYVPYVVSSAVMLALVVSFAAWSYTSSVKSNLNRAKKMLKEEKVRAAKAITLSTQLPELEERATSLVERVNGKICWWEILDQITRCCPPNAVLSAIKVEYGPNSERPVTLLISGSYEDSTGLEITFTRNLKTSAKLGMYVDEIYPGQTTLVADRTLFIVKCKFRQTEQEDETVEGEQ